MLLVIKFLVSEIEGYLDLPSLTGIVFNLSRD